MKTSIILLTFLFCGTITFSQTKYDEYYNSSITYLRSNDLDVALTNINEAIKLKSNKADAIILAEIFIKKWTRIL
ncbi:MAG: hypothetical protein ACTIJ9_07315 [Aequorivita sp.]